MFGKNEVVVVAVPSARSFFFFRFFSIQLRFVLLLLPQDGGAASLHASARRGIGIGNSNRFFSCER